MSGLGRPIPKMHRPSKGDPIRMMQAMSKITPGWDDPPVRNCYDLSAEYVRENGGKLMSGFATDHDGVERAHCWVELDNGDVVDRMWWSDHHRGVELTP